MTLGWTINQDYIELNFKVTIIQCKLSIGYCSLGYRQTIRNWDIVGIFIDSKGVTLEDCYSYTNEVPDTDSELGTKKDYEHISGGLDSDGYIDITFRRKLNTGDKHDEVIRPDIRTKKLLGLQR